MSGPRCLRSSGTERKLCETAEEAVVFRDSHPAYFGDVVVFCGRCGAYHCTNPNWIAERPWEILADRLRAN